MSDWMTVGDAAEIEKGQLLGATVGGEELVIANVDGTYRALGAICTHAGCNLAEDGELDEGGLSCICHGSVFDPDSGEPVNPPAQDPLPVYDVRVEGGEVQVAVPGG